MDEIKTIYLASKSPRRYEILSRLGMEICVCPTDAPEITDKIYPSDMVTDLAKLKLGNLAKDYPNRLIIGCDTIVWHNGIALGKPEDKADAREMLMSLSGKTHQVYTGYAIAFMGNVKLGYCMSQVKIKDLTDDVISNYIQSGSPMDKAGAYGVQDDVVTQSFCGDYDNIVGMPLYKILNTIDKMFAEVGYETRISHRFRV